MSFVELLSIYCILESMKERIGKLYEDWDFGRQKQDTGLARSYVGRASAKIFDTLYDEFPEQSEFLEELRHKPWWKREIENHHGSAQKESEMGRLVGEHSA